MKTFRTIQGESNRAIKASTESLEMPPALITFDFGSYPNIEAGEMRDARRKVVLWMGDHHLRGRVSLTAEVRGLCVNLRALCLLRHAPERIGFGNPIPEAVRMDHEVLDTRPKITASMRKLRNRVTGSPTRHQRTRIQAALGPYSNPIGGAGR